MFRDLVVAFRGLLRAPWFALVAVAMLALGIGVNTLMYSVIHSVLLRPLPGYQTERLVRIYHPADQSGAGFIPPEVYEQIRRQSNSFEAVAANQFCRMNLTGMGQPEQLTGPCVTANWFKLQHADAMLGRTFLPDEDQPGRNHVVVLDHGYWQRRFGGDPNIINQTLRFNHEAWLVVGVMRPEFKAMGLTPYPIYTAYVPSDHPDGVNITARLRPGHTIEAARAELNVLANRLAQTHPEWKHLKLTATPVLEDATGQQRPLLLLLLGAVTFVFLIACVNVSNLLLARSTARRHEIDVRLALGASRAQIIRFFLAEALLIATGAAAAAIGLAYGGLRLIGPLTATLPRADELSIDVSVLMWTLVLGFLAAVLFGTVPALRLTGVNRAASMRARVPGGGWQRSFMAVEVALSFLLLVGASLLIQTFVAIRSTDLGYHPQNVLTHFLALSPSADNSRTAGVQLYQRIRDRIARLPGVESVATASTLPMFGVSISLDVHPDGQPGRRNEHQAAVDVISTDYFRVMRIPVRQGRVFNGTDQAGSPRVAVVSESVAKRYFPNGAIGRRLILPDLLFNIDAGKDMAPEIIGVVGNVCTSSVEERDSEHIYLPETQQALRMENLLIRTKGDPKQLENSVRSAVYQESPLTPLDAALTLEERTAYLTDGPRRSMWLLSASAGLALLLAMFGIYSVSAYLVAQRKQEIGIRIAVGAASGHIARFVYGSMLPPLAGGLAAGALAASGLAKYLNSVVFGVAANDPWTMALAAGALLATAGFAVAGPALLAMAVDPVQVLRRE